MLFKNISLAKQIIILSTFLILFTASISATFSIVFLQQQLINNIQEELKYIVNTAAPAINVPMHENIFITPDGALEGQAEFEHIRKYLTSVKTGTNLKTKLGDSPIYTLRVTKDNALQTNLEFVVMTDKNQAGNYFIGNLLQTEAHHLQAINDKTTVITGVYQDEFGAWISAVAPLFSTSGKVIALLQADKGVDFYYQEYFGLVKTIITAILIAIIVGIFLSILFAQYLLRPLKRLSTMVRAISNGELNRRVRVQRTDEIGLLAATFNQMAESLYEKQQEILSYQTTLEDKITRRTKDLQRTNEQLINSKNQLVQAEKMASIGQLSAGIAHEINNPIAFVMNNIEALQDYLDDLIDIVALTRDISAFKSTTDNLPEFIKKLETIIDENDFEFIQGDYKKVISQTNNGLNRVKDIVSALKNFARADDSKFNQANINDGLDSTLKIAANELKNKAEVITDYGNIPKIPCNLGELNQVFLNLLINAAHAIEAAGKITIKTWADDKKVYISIADNGCGIPPDKIKKIFDPFFTTKEVGVGTGLGLSISYGIIENHHGEITVNSELNAGTEFIIALPIKLDQAAQQ